MSFQVQILATVPAKLFKRPCLLLSEGIAIHHMASKTMQKVAEEVDVFDGLHGSMDTVHACTHCCIQHAQSHFVQDLVS